jgi:hypothetical protein
VVVEVRCAAHTGGDQVVGPLKVCAEAVRVHGCPGARTSVVPFRPARPVVRRGRRCPALVAPPDGARAFRARR